jgi:ribosomal protein S18 acetylase RimI-like enzyme
VKYPMTMSIRPLVDSDLERADDILKLAFQGSVSRLSELQLYRRIQPDGWFIATREDIPVGMVGATNYGAFAHVGFMAVHPQAQRQGVGLALMQFLLGRLEQQVPLVMLDSSATGRPLYDKLGFTAYDETLMFQLQHVVASPHRPAHVRSISARDLDELAEEDARVFGANRRKVLQTLLEFFPGGAFLQRDADGKIMGYLFTQPNRIGPWVMLQPGQAEGLLQAALTLMHDETVSVTVPAGNQEAKELLHDYGFDHLRTNRHMGRGVGGPPGQRQKVFSQTSLAIG